MESKKEIYDLIPPQFIPKTNLIDKTFGAEEIINSVAGIEIQLPFIIKPDIGLKGLGVQIIHSAEELSRYLQTVEGELLIQEFIEYSQEVGIFYYRIPGEPNGEITGIVQKEFLSVTGNGSSNLLELIKSNPRCMNQYTALEKMYTNRFAETLPQGEKLILIPYGSHTRGSLFIDISHQLNPELYNVINSICKNINGFYFGRMDVMFSSWDELCKGEKFSIIELNGAGSEPTHIYDPGHSIFFAWREIIRHWNLLFRISLINKKKGYPFLSTREGRQMIKESRMLEKRLTTT